ncbi:hypothetical protein E4T48_01681 [Aureobasidium sp. EXF-10727]|nr:hypothetical protein E4T48_01681 [Aureobasidium sp. EXF-10727]
MTSLNSTSGLNFTIGFNATTPAGFNSTDGLNATAVSPATPTRDGLPLQPRLTPAFGVAGALLILTGFAYACASIKIKRFFTVLIIYVMPAPDASVSDGVQGAYLVGIVAPGIILGGICERYAEWLAKRSGCIVGGFCIAMWIEVLVPGGLITSSPMLAVFIGIMCLAALAPSFLEKTEDPAFIICSAFSGTTAFVLGIDCYSRAGLKEFWVYTWQFHRVELFGFGTKTYPLTRGIKAEIGMIPVLFLLAMVFQGKFFKPIREQKERQEEAFAGLRQEHERHELDTGRAVQRTADRERAIWERTYKDPEKKMPDVEQRQVDPPSPSRAGKRFHAAAGFVMDKLKPDTRTLLITDNLERQRNEKPAAGRLVRSNVQAQHHDEITPIEAPRESTEAALDTSPASRPSSFQQYPSLRPTSYPPPPILPQTGYECDTPSDGVDYVNLGSLNPSLPCLTDRVSSLGLALDIENIGASVVPDQDEFEIEASPHLSRPQADEQLAPTPIRQSQQVLSGWEQQITQEPLGEDEAAGEHLAPINHEDTDEPLRYAHLGSKSSDLCEISKTHGHVESPTRDAESAATKQQQREDVMSRTHEWSKTLIHAELKSRPSSIRSYDAKEETSLWSGFEGTHTTEDTFEPLEGQEEASAKPTQHALSRAGPLKQNKRRSRRVSVVEGKTAILPTPVKSARVDERNSSLPMLDTGTTLIDERRTIAEQKQRQMSLTNNFITDESQGIVARRNFGSHGKFTNSNDVESTDLDDITLSQARTTLHARSMSNSQVSTISSPASHAPRTSSSVGYQSPALTTARTTPITSSPVHTCPPFMMVAHPLRKPYPMPPCETFQPTAPPFRHSGGVFTPNPAFTLSGVNDPATVMQNNDPYTPRAPRRASVPVGFAAKPTLMHRIEFDESLKKQNQEALLEGQRRGAAEATQSKKQQDKQRRRTLEAENMMRRGHLDDAHREAMRKIQRQANKSFQQS